MTQAEQPMPQYSIDPGLLSLAMAFVPVENFNPENIYEPALGFSRGTIFPYLDKPFLGEEAVPK